MDIQSNGSLRFRTKNGIFIFQKTNYDKHCLKHEILEDNLFLEEIEKILNYPDTITAPQTINKKINIYYGVLKRINNKYSIQVRVIRIPFIKSKKVNFILSAFDLWAFNWQVIHNSEKIIWQKEKSLLS